MNPRDFLQLARQLKEVRDAHSRRTAVGRAYYAAYNVVIEVLEGFNRTDQAQFLLAKDGSMHGHVIDLLRAADDEELDAASRDLRQMLNKRHRADYEPANPNGDGTADAEFAVAAATRVIDRLDAFRACQDDRRRGPAIRAMLRWHQQNLPRTRRN